MQQGDCNAPTTFQQLMTSIFHDVIGRFLHFYLDIIFIFSNSPKEHEWHLQIMFEQLHANSFFLKWSKCNLYVDKVDCLGHIIDKNGIHTDVDKLSCIREWCTPCNYNDIQRFVELVNYLIDPMRNDEPIWLICDAPKLGVGAMYGQGPTWQKCCPAGFMSKKFMTAQHNYAVHELKTLAILDALLKWKDKLVGYQLHVITNHQALSFSKLSHTFHPTNARMDYMSKFDFDITYVKGELNKVPDCLSRYCESDTNADVHDVHEYVRADSRINSAGKDLPKGHYHEVINNFVELCALQEIEHRRSKHLQKHQED